MKGTWDILTQPTRNSDSAAHLLDKLDISLYNNVLVQVDEVKRRKISALLFQIFLPAIRVVTQILGVVAGKSAGMVIIQYTQLITILGGPVGYM